MSLKGEQYRRDMYLSTYPVNLQYCAVILRLADLVDLNPERTPKVLLDFILSDLQPRIHEEQVEFAYSKSAEEWAKHRAILGLKVDSEEIRIEAQCSHPAIQRGLREWCDLINVERRDCRLVVQDNRREITEKYTLDLSQDVRKDYIVSDGSYIYTDFKFQLDYDRIVNLLMGTELWGDPAIVYRELLQNAVDACHHRQALSKKLGLPYEPKISFHFTQSYDNSTHQTILTCEDNGSGMDQRIVENFLMHIGRSFYESTEFRRQNLAFYPISHFGLGVMSCFMLTNTVRIETQHINEELVKGDALSIDIDSSGKYVVIRPLEKNREGTSVSLSFQDRIRGAHLADYKSVHNSITDPAIAYNFLRDLAVHLDIPIDISYGNDYQDRIEPREFSLPGIYWGELPAMKQRYREFIFEYKHEDTGGLAGKFRFLFPCDDNDRICFGCTVDSIFKMFIDDDGDLCLSTPTYSDNRLHTHFEVSGNWHDVDDAEIRGVYRYKYHQKPPASDKWDSNSDILEVVKSNFRWSQDGLIVGQLRAFQYKHYRYRTSARGREEDYMLREEEYRHYREDDRDGDDDKKDIIPNLFKDVLVPGLNAADIDIRGPWRTALNVQRTDFDHGASINAFKHHYYLLVADMWKEILRQTHVLGNLDENLEFIEELFRRSEPQLRANLQTALDYRPRIY